MNQAEFEASISRVGVIAACLIQKDKKILLVQEGQPRAYGLWNFPAGYVDKSETIEAAAIREAREETGYDVKIIKEIALIHESATSQIKHVFTADIIGGELAPEDHEILDTKWLTLEEIKVLNDSGKIRAPWIWKIITKNK